MIGTKHIGHQAVAMMDRLGVPPLTRNYHLFYTCIANANPAVRKAVRNLGKYPTQHELDQVIAEYCPEAAGSQTLQRHENAVLRALEELTSRLQSEQSEISSFNSAVERVSTALSRTVEQQALTEQLLVKVAAAIEEAGQRRAASGQRTLSHLDGNEKEIAALRNELIELRKLANTDPLTCLFNRRSFDEALAHAMGDAAEFALILLDIDHFKRVNDAYGHAFGDQVIKTVADRTRRAVRKGTFLARTGGEEFAVIVRNAREEDAVVVAERIRQTVETMTMHRGAEEIKITVSLGVANSQAVETQTQLYEAADAALYRSKNAGRNRVTVYDSFQQGSSSNRYRIYSG